MNTEQSRAFSEEDVQQERKNRKHKQNSAWLS
jgi:hypothetical protein